MLIDSPIGPLVLEASDRGLTRVRFGGPEDAAGPETPLLRDVARQLAEYFAGKRTVFDVPLDVPASGFRAEAQAALDTIGYGETVSYAQLAAACGSPRAARAVGSACANNPVPIIRPCHRVLHADGSIGGYLGGEIGGVEVKRWLLDHEQRVLGTSDPSAESNMA